VSFSEAKKQVKKIVLNSLKANDLPLINFDPNEPPNSDYGDLSVNISFSLAKQIDSEPYEVAQRIISKISLPKDSLIKEFWIQKPAYINFRLDYGLLAYLVFHDILPNRSYSKINLGENKRVAVEHTSVNPNKALHYGHLRNVVIGDSIGKILEFVGYKVQVLNYIDDSGLQVADLIVGFKYADFPLNSEHKKFDEYCGDVVYTQVNDLYNERKDLVEAQTKVLGELENHYSETAIFAAEITQRILKEQLKTCWRIGARYDLLNFESHILQTEMWLQIFNDLKARGIAEKVVDGKYAGCWIVRIEGEAEGEEKVLVRSDGTATYIAKDIPYAAWKLGIIKDRFGYEVFLQQPGGQNLWRTTLKGSDNSHPWFSGYDRAITVIDVRQGRLQRIIGRIIEEITSQKKEVIYDHLGYEVVFLSGATAEELGFESKGKKIVGMSGRRGIYVNADKVLDIINKKAYDETKKRNPEEKEDWIKKTAEKIAVAAVRFDLLKQDLDKTIIFDLNKALSLDGETGPYLQYTYARAMRLLKKAGSTEAKPSRDSANRLTDSSEVELVKEISKFDMYIEDAAKALSPKIIARYLFNLVSLFNVFYEKKPVIRENDVSIKLARLVLVLSFTKILKKGLELLGIESPERI
jgi:arginyl-tRNA synthetase